MHPGDKDPVGVNRDEVKSTPKRERPHDVADQSAGRGDEDIAGPTLPANASGQDKVTTSEQSQPIDKESMYDRRPSEDKDNPPSKAVD